MTTGRLDVQQLDVTAGEFHLDGIDITVNAGEYFVVLGPTGAGKTILLETIAGLRRVRRGTVHIDNEDVTQLPPERRGVGFVYQDYALFPHLTVAANIAFGLRLRRRKNVDHSVARIAALLGIDTLQSRMPRDLSGGEQQRVALARALAVAPRVLLLDEPLSALDPQTREGLQRELAQLHRELSTTTVHVTHDFEEAAALADRIGVMNAGRIVQVGTVDAIFRRPSSPFVARFVGARNVFAGAAIRTENEETQFIIDGVTLATATAVTGPAHAALRPEDILISATPLTSSARNCLHGRITGITDRGMIVYITVDIPPEFVAAVTHRSVAELGLAVGKEVYISFKASAVHVF